MESAEEKFERALRGLTAPVAVEGDVGGEEPTELIETNEEDPSRLASTPAPTTQGALQSPKTHPVVLSLLLLRLYGPDWLLWDPETLQWALHQDFPGGISDLNLHRLQALKTLHTTEHPWKEWEVFTWVCMPLTGVLPDFEVMQVPTAAQIVVGIDTFNRIRSDVAWSDEVKAFLANAWKMDGLVATVPPADFLELDAHEFAVDVADVKKRWPDVKVSSAAPKGQTAEDEQLRRMLDVHKALLESQDEFNQQAKVLVQ